MTKSETQEPIAVGDSVNLDEHAELAASLVHDVFSTMLDTEAAPDPASADPARRYPVVGAIYFAGGFKGAVLIELEHSLAFEATARLMDVPRPSRVDADVRDAVGELANMIAGNLKAILPPETMISMPSVVEGSDFVVSVVGANSSSRMAFSSPHGAMSLTLVEVNRMRRR
ncbi:MAG: hypothetical protein GC160_18495 [Acidobacteria bacterium]|nr:hypothetical protein [Acidobacteriota bacterium]